jgi:hypothetical protein
MTYANEMEDNHTRAKSLFELANPQKNSDETFGLDANKSVLRKTQEVYASLLKNQTRATEQLDYLFEHENFTVEPKVGSIWPNSFVDVKVSFTSKRASEYQTTAFCEVEGRESRLPLVLKVILTDQGKSTGAKGKVCLFEIWNRTNIHQHIS